MQRTLTAGSENALGNDFSVLRRPLLQAIQSVEPEADIVLYGSRARNTAAADSDWDLLILVDGPVDDHRKTTIRHRLYEVELELDQVLSSIIVDRDDWNSPRFRAMPLHERIARDGIRL